MAKQAQAAGLLSDEHFTVDGTLIEAAAGQKSLRQAGGEPPPAAGGGRNAEVDFHGQRRSNDTHLSSTDPEAMLARKTRGSETKLAYRGHLLTGNRNGLVAGARVTHAYGNAESHAALQMLEQVPGDHAISCGADRGYDSRAFVQECDNLNVRAHVARRRIGSALPAGIERQRVYRQSQRKRKRVEEVFGWLKTIALLRKARHRGRERVDWMFVFGAAAYNLVRMRKLMAQSA